MDDEVMRGCFPVIPLVRASSCARAVSGHPTLSAEDRHALAEHIALMDGITRGEAVRQIEELMQCDLEGFE